MLLNISTLKFRPKLKFNTCRDSSTFIFSYLPLPSNLNRQDSKSMLIVAFWLPLDMLYFKAYYHAIINHVDAKMNYNWNAACLDDVEEDFSATEDIRFGIR